jgi:hypothetical protein
MRHRIIPPRRDLPLMKPDEVEQSDKSNTLRHSIMLDGRVCSSKILKEHSMPISELSAVERIARVLAAERLSVNAEGYERSVGDEVDAEWHLYIGQAVAVLKTLREPDIVMANAGDPELWRAMIEAALADYEGDPAQD